MAVPLVYAPRSRLADRCAGRRPALGRKRAVPARRRAATCARGAPAASRVRTSPGSAALAGLPILSTGFCGREPGSPPNVASESMPSPP